MKFKKRILLFVSLFAVAWFTVMPVISAVTVGDYCSVYKICSNGEELWCDATCVEGVTAYCRTYSSMIACSCGLAGEVHIVLTCNGGTQIGIPGPDGGI